MSAKPLPRPRQVTFSGWSIIVGSVLTILYAFQRVSELGSLEAQEAAADFISTPPGDGLGMSLDDVELAIRIMCLVAGGTAAAAAILGWQVLQGSRSARVVLSVLAPILFVAGLTSGGLFSALVAAGVVMLWVQPARDWFNGRAPAPSSLDGGRGSGATSHPPIFAPPSGGDSSVAPTGAPTPPTPPTPSTQPPPPPPAAGATATESHRQEPDHLHDAPASTQAGVRKRPGTVTAAAMIAILASGLALAGLLVSLLYLVSSRAEFLEQIDEQLATSSAYADISADTLADAAVGFLVVLAVWCLVAIGLAIATLRGSNAARIGLVVSGLLSALVSLLGALVIVPLVLTIASIATVVLLFTGGAGEWFASHKRTG